MLNALKQKLIAKQPVFGVWSLMPSAMSVEATTLGGVDFLILDMEHGIFEPSSLDTCIRACEAAGSAPLVRIPGLNASAAQWALDSGAHGIIVPQISGVEEARAAVALTKFPPVGVRGYNPFVRAANYSGGKEEGGKLSNEFPLAAIIVETSQSLNELEAICKLDGLDVIYIGVYDLSVVLGYDGDVGHPEIQKIVKSSVEKITRAGKTAGLMARDEAGMKEAFALGATMILGGVDTTLLRNAAADKMHQFISVQGK